MYPRISSPQTETSWLQSAISLQCPSLKSNGEAECCKRPLEREGRHGRFGKAHWADSRRLGAPRHSECPGVQLRAWRRGERPRNTKLDDDNERSELDYLWHIQIHGLIGAFHRRARVLYSPGDQPEVTI